MISEWIFSFVGQVSRTVASGKRTIHDVRTHFYYQLEGRYCMRYSQFYSQIRAEQVCDLAQLICRVFLYSTGRIGSAQSVLTNEM
jgi:hypothetical protein